MSLLWTSSATQTTRSCPEKKHCERNQSKCQSMMCSKRWKKWSRIWSMKSGFNHQFLFKKRILSNRSGLLESAWSQLQPPSLKFNLLLKPWKIKKLRLRSIIMKCRRPGLNWSWTDANCQTYQSNITQPLTLQLLCKWNLEKILSKICSSLSCSLNLRSIRLRRCWNMTVRLFWT